MQSGGNSPLQCVAPYPLPGLPLLSMRKSRGDGVAFNTGLPPRPRLEAPEVKGCIPRPHAGRSASAICSHACLRTSSRGYPYHQCYSCWCIAGLRTVRLATAWNLSALSQGALVRKRLLPTPFRLDGPYFGANTIAAATSQAQNSARPTRELTGSLFATHHRQRQAQAS